MPDQTPANPLQPCDCNYRDDIVLLRQSVPDLVSRVKILERRMLYVLALVAASVGTGGADLVMGPDQTTKIIRQTIPAADGGELPAEAQPASSDETRRDSFLRLVLKSAMGG